MALFDFTFIHSQLFWLFVSFFTLLIFMYKFAGPAISKSLDERADQIRKDLEDAERLKKESEELLASYNEKMEQANAKAQLLLQEAKDTAKEIADREAKELEKVLKNKSEQATKQLDSAKEKALGEISSEVHKVVIQATEKLIKETVDSKKAKELTKEALNDLN